MPRPLITGVIGPDGLYLAELLASKGYELYGLIGGQNNPKYDLVRRTVTAWLVTRRMGRVGSHSPT